MNRAMRAAATIAALVCVAAASEATAAVTYGYTVQSCGVVQYYTNGVAWADLHYIVNGGGQLNVRMTQSGTRATYTVSGLVSGATIRYFFTYVPSGSSAAADTPWATMTVDCSGGDDGGSSSGGGSSDGCNACIYHTLKWWDEFDGSGKPSSTSWNYHVGNGYNPGLPGFQGWGNGEWEWYRPEQVYQQNGNLVIRADYSSTPTAIAGRNWYQRSGRVTTQGRRSWTNARIEARIAMPNKAATWPAFWMMGNANDGTYTSNYAAPIGYYDTMATNWASCGEIDIMEHKNADTATYQNLFWDTRVGVFPWAGDTIANNPGSYNVGDVTQFHTYAVEWNASNMYWYVDNVRVKTQSVAAGTQEEFRQGFFIILNLALAGAFPGTTPVQSDFPLYMYVDYVRVYQ
jgi:beta-glucanase (GH16 family)